jgi:hypothetical protein
VQEIRLLNFASAFSFNYVRSYFLNPNIRLISNNSQ